MGDGRTKGKGLKVGFVVVGDKTKWMPLDVGLDGLLASLRVLVVMRDGQGCSSLTLLPHAALQQARQGSAQDPMETRGNQAEWKLEAKSEAGGARVWCYWGGGGEAKAKKRAPTSEQGDRCTFQKKAFVPRHVSSSSVPSSLKLPDREMALGEK